MFPDMGHVCNSIASYLNFVVLALAELRIVDFQSSILLNCFNLTMKLHYIIRSKFVPNKLAFIA